MKSLRMIKKSIAALVMCMCFSVPNLTADIAFSENDFKDGSFIVSPTITSFPKEPDSSFSVTSSRFTSQNQGNFIIQQFQLNYAPNDFNAVMQPLFLTDFFYDPQTHDPIQSLAAKIHVFPVVNNPPSVTVAFARLFIHQNNKIFRAVIDSFTTDDLAQNLSRSGMTAENFTEISNGSILLDSHPDFNNGQMQFGFGIAVTNTTLDSGINHLIFTAIDDFTVRIKSAPIPEPASASLLVLATLTLLCRPRTLA
ncbi:hypothetical protein KS4_07360 [Poriferisphaera corsica]|uniref:PEP-CTERM sorting domain-containing protein n=1 Tax=Poriferisphaera corsica TaxID=2528020 RepID=A0A517YR56_9BACT|nr:hypothetical protein [Poriferisphaera corsica]QDU32702.1 hypothetical protein KS4_07360 [Poriferisphaera corsica]